jgi:activator of Hsp90 ATPase-like protein
MLSSARRPSLHIQDFRNGSRHSSHPGVSGSPQGADIRPMPAFMSTRPLARMSRAYADYGLIRELTSIGRPRVKRGRVASHKVGGTYRMSFRNFTTGMSHSFGGKYLEFVPGERLRYTDRFEDPNLPGGSAQASIRRPPS